MDAAVLVLLLLGLIWAAVLIPPWLQSRRDQGPAASMRSFHRQLWSLEKASPAYGLGNGRPGSAGGRGYPGRGYAAANHVSAYPPYATDGVGDGVGVAPGYGLPAGYGPPVGYGSAAAAAAGGVGASGIANDDGPAVGHGASAGYGMPAGPEAGEMAHGNGVGVGVVEGIRDSVVRIDRVVSVDGDGFDGVDGVDASQINDVDHDPNTAIGVGHQPVSGKGVGHDPTADGVGVAAAPVSATASADVRRRRLGYHRRRRVLTVLLTVVTVTLVPALLLGGDGWWLAQGVANTLLLGYVALLIRRQRRLRERREKIRYLTAFRPPRPSVIVFRGDAAR